MFHWWPLQAFLVKCSKLCAAADALRVTCRECCEWLTAARQGSTAFPGAQSARMPHTSSAEDKLAAQRMECCLFMLMCFGSWCLSLVQGVLREAYSFQACPDELTRSSLARHLFCRVQASSSARGALPVHPGTLCRAVPGMCCSSCAVSSPELSLNSTG